MKSLSGGMTLTHLNYDMLLSAKLTALSLSNKAILPSLTQVSAESDACSLVTYMAVRSAFSYEITSANDMKCLRWKSQKSYSPYIKVFVMSARDRTFVVEMQKRKLSRIS